MFLFLLPSSSVTTQMLRKRHNGSIHRPDSQQAVKSPPLLVRNLTACSEFGPYFHEILPASYFIPPLCCMFGFCTNFSRIPLDTIDTDASLVSLLFLTCRRYLFLLNTLCSLVYENQNAFLLSCLRNAMTKKGILAFRKAF